MRTSDPEFRKLKNIRYRLVPLHELSPARAFEIEQEISGRFKTLSGKRSYDEAQELAIQLSGCEINSVDDMPVICLRQRA